MKIEKFAAEINRGSESEINTLPVLSLLMILIPFLLLTTVFVETTVLDLHLPPKGKTVSPEKAVKKERPGLFVIIDGQGLRTGVNSRISPYFETGELAREIGLLKNKYDDRLDITVVSSPEIKYQRIVDIMTITVNSGFSQISISDDKSFFKNLPKNSRDI